VTVGVTRGVTFSGLAKTKCAERGDERGDTFNTFFWAISGANDTKKAKKWPFFTDLRGKMQGATRIGEAKNQ
jgi:hypothetical protein